MLPVERGPTAREGGAIAGPAAWCARQGRSTPRAGGRRCLTAPEMQSPLEGEQTLLRRVAIQLLYCPKFAAIFRGP